VAAQRQASSGRADDSGNTAPTDSQTQAVSAAADGDNVRITATADTGGSDGQPTDKGGDDAQHPAAAQAGAAAPKPDQAAAKPAQVATYAAQVVAQDATAADNTAAPAPAIKPAADPAPSFSADAAASSALTDASSLDAAQAPSAPDQTNVAPQVIAQPATAKPEAVQGPAHAPAASHSVVVDQVAVRMIKAVGDGVDRLSIALNPPELGRVEVRMEIGPQGHVNAVFTADRPQTADMLQRGAHDLSRSLQDAGLRADNGSLSFNLRGQNQQQQQQQANLFGSADARLTRGSADDFAEAAPAPAAVYRRPANNSRLDISV
jgi:hypothetical protein